MGPGIHPRRRQAGSADILGVTAALRWTGPAEPDPDFDAVRLPSYMIETAKIELAEPEERGAPSLY
jgi:hypothetical protein